MDTQTHYIQQIHDKPSRPERILQFGTGVFLRGFFASFIQKANDEAAFNGSIVVVGSTENSGVNALQAQNGLFTIFERGLEEGKVVERAKIVDSVSRALAASQDWDAILETATDPNMQLVVSNTTEVGIVFDESDDLNASPPKSFPAKLAVWLIKRAEHFGYDVKYAPVVLPCELIEDNGVILKGIIKNWGQRIEGKEQFLNWLESVTFCNSLVDQIVTGIPARDTKTAIEDQLGYQDDLLTVCEPYRLFAIESDAKRKSALAFLTVSPQVIIEEDITPFRLRKVHLLNGAHSISAFKALEMGIRTVSEGMKDPELRAFIENVMMDEIVPSLPVEGAEAFAQATLERFENPFIAHPWANITLQATKKMAVRIVPILEKYVALHQSLPTYIVQGFAAFLRGRREENGALPVDADAVRIQQLWREHDDSEEAFVRAICMDRMLWNGHDLSEIPCLVDTLAKEIAFTPLTADPT